MQIILTGFQGAGKTRLGIQVARNIGVPFFDIDQELLRKEQGTSISELYCQIGEREFRKKEAQLVHELLEKEAVIALGGGSLTYKEVQEQVKTRKAVYLYRPLVHIYEQLKIRKPIYVQPEELISFLYRRHEAYQQCCHALIPCALLPEETQIKRIEAYGE